MRLNSKRFIVSLFVLIVVFLVPVLSFATDDIIWQNNHGQVHFWPIKNGKRLGGINIHDPVSNTWSLKGVGDVEKRAVISVDRP